MRTLHRGSYEDIIDLLNQAKHIEKYNPKGKLAMHTGFTFKIHTGTEFELLYEYFDSELVYQPTSYRKFPVITGLEVFTKHGQFFDSHCCNSIIDKILFDASGISELATSYQDILTNNYAHQFEILENNGNIVDSFPLIKEYIKPIYNGRNKFLSIN